jgi:hypothetical protein
MFRFPALCAFANLAATLLEGCWGVEDATCTNAIDPVTALETASESSPLVDEHP